MAEIERSAATGWRTAMDFEGQHKKNMHILGLIRDEPAWALSRILLAEKCEAACREIAEFDLVEFVGPPIPAMQAIARKALP